MSVGLTSCCLEHYFSDGVQQLDSDSHLSEGRRDMCREQSTLQDMRFP